MHINVWGWKVYEEMPEKESVRETWTTKGMWNFGGSDEYVHYFGGSDFSRYITYIKTYQSSPLGMCT